MSLTLNERAAGLTEQLLATAAKLNVNISTVGGARIIDAGVHATCGIPAGIALARVCLADLGEVRVSNSYVHVLTDHPVAACLASQYAGWQVQVDKWFGMGSGPMRAIYGKEPLFDDIGHREKSDFAVGVLEARKLPTPEVVEYLAGKLNLPAERLTLWVARTSSQAGLVQVVARSIEVALHKMHELKFDLNTIRVGRGTAPLPPCTTDDDLVALGRTNDAILYGGLVKLVVDANDDMIAEFGPRTAASNSLSFGTPFLELFKAAGHDFYKMDPHLFAPAVVILCSSRTGKKFTFGKMAPDVLARSFGN